MERLQAPTRRRSLLWRSQIGKRTAPQPRPAPYADKAGLRAHSPSVAGAPGLVHGFLIPKRFRSIYESADAIVVR